MPVNLPVQQPNTAIQICGKGYPNEIRDLQPGSSPIHLAESTNHHNNNNPQNQEPDKRKTEVLQIKENQTPTEIKGQLNGKNPKTAGTDTGRRCNMHPGGAATQQSKEDCPNYGKYCAGRR